MQKWSDIPERTTACCLAVAHAWCQGTDDAILLKRVMTAMLNDHYSIVIHHHATVKFYL